MRNKYPLIYGIGNPLIDITINAKDSDIVNLGMDKGTMKLVDEKQQLEIISYFKNAEQKFSPGGSAPNTIIACAGLGVPSLISGKIGKDKFGDIYLNQVKKIGALSGLVQTDGPTGTSIVLVTPDGERTMNTHLGTCRDYGSDDIDIMQLADASYFYFTGYMWDTLSQKGAIQKAISIAKGKNIRIGFDVADPFVVKRYKNEFIKMIRDDVDIVFANEAEIGILFESANINKSINQLRQIVKTGCIKLGGKGSIIFNNNEKYHVKANHVIVKDTTGAGDMYAAGFLSSISQRNDYQLAGEWGSILAEEIIQISGTQFDKKTIDRLKHKLISFL